MNPPPPSPGFSLVERLSGLPYFRALDPERLEALAQQALRRTFDAGAFLFGQDEPSAGLWIVERGRVKIVRLTPEGRELILRLAGPGDSFNDIPAIDGQPNAASALALSDVTVWNLPTGTLRAELHADHDLALATIDILTDRIRFLVQQIEDLTLCSVTTRLARFLLKQPDETALSGPGITRATIAAYLATTPETVSRALRTLETIGAIRFDRHTIVIAREDLLRSVAME